MSPKELRGSFNSKLVRLEDGTFEDVITYSVEFQFQTGAIRSKRIIAACKSYHLVSIPNWFD